MGASRKEESHVSSSPPPPPSSLSPSTSGILCSADSEPPASFGDDVYVRAGDVVGGKYVVERVLGIGGMAFVVSARHVELDEVFALKFLGALFLGNEPVVERFLREARAACRIASEHVVRVFDVGTHDGAPYLVMERLVGRDLGALAAEGTLGIADVVEIVMQTCEGLAAAHAVGVVHRDVKPENLFVVDQAGVPLVKILDFGISKHSFGRQPGAPRLTGEASLGTPSFMAPEQIRDAASVDARSDIWALGVVLYELVTGTEAFLGGNVSEVCAAVLEQEPRPVHEVAPLVADELVEVIARCLRKDPSERYANVAELASALAPFAPGRAVLAVERSSCRLGVTVPPRVTGSTALERGGRASARHPAEARPSPTGVGHTRTRLRLAIVVAATTMVGLAAAAVGLVARSSWSANGTTPNVLGAADPGAVPAGLRASAVADASDAVVVFGVRAKRAPEPLVAAAPATAPSTSARKGQASRPASSVAPETVARPSPSAAEAVSAPPAPPSAAPRIELGY